MKIGDLVLQNDTMFVVMSIDWTGCGYMVMVKNIKTGNTSAFPPAWLTKIKTDNFCP